MIENFHLFLNVVVYFLNFSGIICMMFVITINYNYFAMVDQLFLNWNMGFIKEVIIVNKTRAEKEFECPDNYDHLFKYKWL